MEKVLDREPLIHRFTAMGCPCEILLDLAPGPRTDVLLGQAIETIARLETKYSRYRSGSVVSRINASAGRPFQVDEETARLLDFAAECYEVSDGLFDVTRKDGSQMVWKRPTLQLPAGFDIDFGGLVKEYAVDRTLELLRREAPDVSVLVNLGGDVAAAGERAWRVGIAGTLQHIVLRAGGVATSGITERGGHILHPKTGQPVTDAPLAVTVTALTCTEAGFWSTLAVLQGAGAEQFLKDQALEFLCRRAT